MLRLLGETYLYPFQYLFRPESHLPHVVSTLYLFLLAVSFLNSSKLRSADAWIYPAFFFFWRLRCRSRLG